MLKNSKLLSERVLRPCEEADRFQARWARSWWWREEGTTAGDARRRQRDGERNGESDEKEDNGRETTRGRSRRQRVNDGDKIRISSRRKPGKFVSHPLSCFFHEGTETLTTTTWCHSGIVPECPLLWPPLFFLLDGPQLVSFESCQSHSKSLEHMFSCHFFRRGFYWLYNDRT